MLSSLRRRTAPVLLGQGNAAEPAANHDGSCPSGPALTTLVSPAAVKPPTVTRVDPGIRVVCGCGLFSLTFRNLKAARLGIFHCLICGWRQPMAPLLEVPDHPDNAVKDNAGA